MITKNRLEELIQEKATVYTKYKSYVLINIEKQTPVFWFKREVEIQNNYLHFVYKDVNHDKDCDELIKLEDLYEIR